MTRHSHTTSFAQIEVDAAPAFQDFRTYPAHNQEGRDSSYFSSSSNGEASKHTSMGSYSNHLSSPTTSGYQSSTADKTPSPVSTALQAQPLPSPASSAMSVAAMVSPTVPSDLDKNMLAKLDNRGSYDVSLRASITSNPETLSRRTSIESRGNSTLGFEGIKIASNSPYASNNQSTTSIQSNLQQQRNPGIGSERLSSRYPSDYKCEYRPGSSRFGAENQKQPRTAPTITGPATSAVAHAAEPTPGQPWAFPDGTNQQALPHFRPTLEGESRHNSFVDSRRSSIADSFTSSQYTTESQLPHGQRRLDDGTGYDHRRSSRASSEFQTASHHHHSLKHKQVGDLRDEDAGSPGSSQPYSRTPELRISHKLAERKRRNEMKELYEQLRELMPQERGPKASKWEILTKAISEYKKHMEQIRGLSEHLTKTQRELDRSRHDTDALREENRQLRHDLSQVTQSNPGHHGVMPYSAQPPTPMESYSSDQYGRAHQVHYEHRQDTRQALPPLNSLHPVQAGPETMSGVQYQHELDRGFRQGYPPRN